MQQLIVDAVPTAKPFHQRERKLRLPGLESRIESLELSLGERDIEVEGLTDELGEAEEAANRTDEHVRALAQIRTLLYAGRCDEARERLEVVLDHLDSAWRTLA